MNEYDFRLVDYLSYYGNARVAHLAGDDQVVMHRSTPGIQTVSIEDFFNKHQQGKLFVMGDVLSPTNEIIECRDGEQKFKAATELAKRLIDQSVLVNDHSYGKTFQIELGNQ